MKKKKNRNLLSVPTSGERKGFQNPATIYGHVWLKLHRRPSDTLSYGINAKEDDLKNC